MKRSFSLTPLLAALALAALSFPTATLAQQSARSSGATPALSSPVRPSADVDVDHIIQAFSSKETQFRQALNQYSFKRDAVVQTIGLGGEISGEYHRTSQFVFDDNGNRYEKILFFPQPTIEEGGLIITPEDIEDLGGIEPFALESSKINRYNFSYVGKEHIDELDLYVFDVAPKVMPSPKSKERLFQGRIWVDDKDLQIVKARGKGVPEGDQRFPLFETYREQIDGRYWFPTYTYADDQLTFKNGQVVHLRMRVRYTDFERFRAKVKVIEEGEPGVESSPSPKPTPKPKP